MKRNRRNFIAAIITLLIATMLMACSSKATPAEEIKEQETETTVEKAETVEVAEVKEEEATPEPTEEPTPEPTVEPTSEPIIYEGIDVRSTLPGLEWIETFVGVITEPKIVIINDETNKKVIIEDGQEIAVEKGDLLVAYTPKLEMSISVFELPITELTSGNNYCTLIVIDEQYFVTRNSCQVVFYSDEEDITINCVLKPE